MALEQPDPVREDPTGAAGASRGKRRGFVLGGACLVVVAGTVTVLAAGDGGDATGAQAASGSAAVARIERQDLVETEEVDGTLGYSDARTVVNRLDGTVTWTPRIGSVVATNHRLYAVDGRAVYLLDGSFPAYRTLESGLQGDDVRQLERNLRRLDLDPDGAMSVDGRWDGGTTAAVRRWQARKGMEQDGSIEAGRIVFQPGARRIGTIALAVGTSAAGSGTARSSSGAGLASSPLNGRSRTVFASGDASPSGTRGFSDIPQERAAPVDATPTPETTPAPTPTPSPTPTPTPTPTPQPTPSPSPAARPAPSPSAAPRPAPSRGSGAPGAPSTRPADAAAGGAGTTAAEPEVASSLMTTTSTKRIVTVDLETTDLRLARRGARVTVEMPDGEELDGTIARVGTVAQKKVTAQDDDPPATVKLIVKLARSTGVDLDQAPVDVRLERSRAKDVLTIPVTALLARAGGTFAVEVREGDERRIVPVDTGRYTDGDVEIEGRGLRPGMTVTDARV